MPGELGEMYSRWGFQEIHHGEDVLFTEPYIIGREHEKEGCCSTGNFVIEKRGRKFRMNPETRKQ